MNPRDPDEARVLERLRSMPPPARPPIRPERPNPLDVRDRRNSPYPYAIGLELITGHPLWAAITGLFMWFRGR